MGLELVSIFLFDFISNYYIAKTIRDQNLNKQIKATPHQRADINASHYNYNYSYNYHNKTNNNAYNSNNNNNNHINTLADSNSNGNGYGARQQAARGADGPKSESAPAAAAPRQLQFSVEFTQPVSLVSFKERVRLNKVHLETCHVNSIAGHVSVSCTIRVLNLAFDKSIIVRYTTDDWHTFTDSLASYVPGSNDGASDKFTSTFSLTNRVSQLQVGQRIIFAVRYTVGRHQVYWDNNAGRNYSVRVTQ